MKFLSNVVLEATPSDNKHLVNVGYLQAVIGQKIKSPVKAVSTSNFSGSYSSGVLTQSTGDAEAFTIDGVELAVNDRVLLSGQTDKKENGIYVVTTVGTIETVGVLTRSDDFNESGEIEEGVAVFVSQGTSNKDTLWYLITNGSITLDTSELEFERKSYKSSDVSTISKFVGDITGDGSTQSFAISHNLGNRNVIVSVYDAVSYSIVECNVTMTDANTVTIEMDTVPTASEAYKVVVIG